jgi:hypothetical protein
MHSPDAMKLKASGMPIPRQHFSNKQSKTNNGGSGKKETAPQNVCKCHADGILTLLCLITRQPFCLRLVSQPPSDVASDDPVAINTVLRVPTCASVATYKNAP